MLVKDIFYYLYNKELNKTADVIQIWDIKNASS